MPDGSRRRHTRRATATRTALTAACGAVAVTWALVWLQGRDLGLVVERLQLSPQAAGEPSRQAAPQPRPATPAETDSQRPDRASSRARPARSSRVSGPDRVRIPSIGLDAPVEPIGLDHTGALEVPEAADEAGWWSGGSAPGEPGPAVLSIPVTTSRPGTCTAPPTVPRSGC